METIFVKPKAGLLVRLADASRHVFAEGEEVLNSSYIRRRLRDGDLVEGAPPKPAKES